MMRTAAGRRGLPAWLSGAAVIVVFVILQAATLNYGTRINGLPHIHDYRVTTDILSGSGLSRDQLVGGKTDRAESLDLWMVRFKLYSIEADEVDNIIALARIRPALWQFDPKFYQYGGAFLYPLGVWYLALSKLGLVHVAPLEQLLSQPQEMNRIWIGGRAFVLAAFTASALLLFLTLMEVAPAPVAVAGLAIYLFCPASIMYSQVIKPHWYALLWANAALLIIVRAFLRQRLTLAAELLLAASIGLAVGSVTTFSLMALLLWCALALLVARGGLDAVALLRVPAVAGVVFLLTNPYYVLNWRAVEVERAAAGAWFQPSLDPGALLMFITNSLFSGFGLVLTLLILGAVAWHLACGPGWTRLFALAIAIPIVAIAIMTTSLATWNVNYRYIPYVLPVALVLLALGRWRYGGLLSALCVVATVVQAAPLKLAYFDENSDANSTRLQAARWIDANIPEPEAICLPTEALVPFNVPPFRFDQRRINSLDCRWLVQVERQPRAVVADPNYEIAKRFTPRLSPRLFPLVWEHINPQITIYHKNG
jgi:hypothetical protein